MVSCTDAVDGHGNNYPRIEKIFCFLRYSDQEFLKTKQKSRFPFTFESKSEVPQACDVVIAQRM